jgi:hypothetical protein
LPKQQDTSYTIKKIAEFIACSGKCHLEDHDIDKETDF